jgi:hypothetical protein
MMRLILLVVIVAVLVLGTLAVRHLQWWALALIFLGLILVGKFAIKWLLKRMFIVPFKMKGAVLRNAFARVNSVATTNPPVKPAGESEDASGDADEDTAEKDSIDDDALKKDEEDEEEEDKVPRSYYVIDVTITPRQPTGKFTHWEPGELVLTRTDLEIDPNTPDFDDDTCRVEEIKVEQDGAFREDEAGKYEGPQRLQITVGVREGVQKLRFQYYFEQFGEVVLPVSAPAG